MIAVIQCAARKREDAGYMIARDGRKVMFVAEPELAPPVSGTIFARPDDPSGSGSSWRAEVVAYNKSPEGNPLRLHPAFELYPHDAYRRVAERFGIDNTCILSAGWGLIEASS